ncbi:hypothetical protein AB0L25_20505 [Spirillospora sp. NPDC052242]
MTAMLRDRDLTHGRLLLGMAAVQLHAARGQVQWKDAARAAVGADPRFLESTCVYDGARTTLSGGHLGWLQDVIKADLATSARGTHWKSRNQFAWRRRRASGSAGGRLAPTRSS